MSSSALRALKILEIVSESLSPIGVTAIAQELDLPAGTVFRSLDALERLGYISRFQSSTDFVAGDTTKRLRQTAFARFYLRDVALPYMRQMSFATGESIALTMPVGWYGVTIGSVTGSNPIRTSSTIGSIEDLSANLPSRTILASFPKEDFSRFLAWAKKKGVKVREKLSEELQTIQSAGYGTEAIDFSDDRASIALPIRHRDCTLGAISIEGPVVHQTSDVDKARIRDWIKTVHAIEIRIADQPDLFVNPYAHIEPDQISLPISRGT